LNHAMRQLVGCVMGVSIILCVRTYAELF